MITNNEDDYLVVEIPKLIGDLIPKKLCKKFFLIEVFYENQSIA